MIISMTAFARAEQGLENLKLVWEIRSVNHRYLDINLKLPDQLRGLEPQCRQLISDVLNRGRVDAHLELRPSGGESTHIGINHQALDNLVGLIAEVTGLVPNLQPARPIDLLGWPGVISESEPDTDSLSELGLVCLKEGLDELVLNRRREGKRLGEIIKEKIHHSRDTIGKLSDSINDIQHKTQTKWSDRIGEMAATLDQERIAQEIAIILTKSDIVEELDRLMTHLDESNRLLGVDQPVGRNLDFLMQELNREANTIGSKSIDKRMTNTAIELKVLIDQMREQVQNIE